MDGTYAPLNVAATAGAYATFGGVLAGFAFAGLCVYLGRDKGGGGDCRASASGSGQVDDTGEFRGSDGNEKLRPVEVKHVTVAVFYSMASLAISSFLYSTLAGVASSSPGAAATAFLSYGIVFALSVLSLFYSVTLMMLEHPLTKDAAKHAYWVVTIAGTIIVLRFLAEAARDAFLERCANACRPPGILSWPGIGFTLLVAAALAVLITMELRDYDPTGKLGKLKHYPTAAPMVVFISVVFVTTTQSLYLHTRGSSYQPSLWMIYVSYAVSIFLVTLFALACGRVVAPRAEVNVASLLRAYGKLPRRSARADPATQAARPADAAKPQGSAANSKKVKRLLLIITVILAFLIFVLGGRQWYLAFFVLLPAVPVTIITSTGVYSRRKSGKHSKETPSSHASAMQ
jgi:hypothetical protein